MWALPTCFWELKNLDRKVCTVSYLMQLTRFANVLPVDALVGQIHDHAKTSAEADWQQEGDFLVNDMNGECAASALHRYWNFCRSDELGSSSDSRRNKLQSRDDSGFQLEDGQVIHHLLVRLGSQDSVLGSSVNQRQTCRNGQADEGLNTDAGKDGKRESFILGIWCFFNRCRVIHVEMNRRLLLWFNILGGVADSQEVSTALLLLPHSSSFIRFVFAFSCPVAFLATSCTDSATDEELLGPPFWPRSIGSWCSWMGVPWHILGPLARRPWPLGSVIATA